MRVPNSYVQKFLQIIHILTYIWRTTTTKNRFLAQDQDEVKISK